MSIRKRLAKVERTVADIAKQKQLEDCICKEAGTAVMFGHTEEFEAEMNRTCSVHGFRRLGHILALSTVAPESYPESEKERIRQENAELERVLERYYARLAAAEAAEADPSSEDL